MFDIMYTLKCHGHSSWFPNSQKNGLSNGENCKSLGCVLAKLQWLIVTCLIIDFILFVP